MKAVRSFGEKVWDELIDRSTFLYMEDHPLRWG
jgi:hypothetical protein